MKLADNTRSGPNTPRDYWSRHSDGNISPQKTPSIVDRHSSNSIWFSKRFLVAIVMFLCFINTTMLLNTMSIAVVDMTYAETVTVDGNTTIIRPAQFPWDTVTIATVASMDWYGGLFAIFAGYFVDKLGGSVSCALCMAIAGILTIFHPAMMKHHFNTFLVCRFLTGFFGYSFFICAPEIYSRWFPKKERSILTAIVLNGVHAGTAISYPLFGFIAEEWKWQTIFYVSGKISIFFSLVCLLVVMNRPYEDAFISEDELAYILDETDDAFRKKEPHPFAKIFLSGPVLALCVGKSTLLWMSTLVSSSLPLYIKDLTDKNIEEIGVLSSIPTCVQIFIFPIIGVLLNVCYNCKNLELTLMHKITVSSAFIACSTCLLAATTFNDFTITIILIVLIHTIGSAALSVFEPITVNLSPNDCSVIAGLVKFVSSICVILSRYSIGYMTVDHSTEGWNDCFLLAAGILVLGAVIFAIFASSEAQPWSSLSRAHERHPLINITYNRRKSFS